MTDDMVFKNEGEDDNFDPLAKKERDVPLLYDDLISLIELTSIAKNADETSAPLSLSASDDDFSTTSDASSLGVDDHSNTIEDRAATSHQC